MDGPRFHHQKGDLKVLGSICHIRDLLEVFHHQSTFYALFFVEGRTQEYLYFSKENAPVYSLLKGNGIISKISKLDRASDVCFECNLASEIEAGISFDTADLVEFSLDKQQANCILTALKAALPQEEREFIKFFG
jgi:hypothetical protein